MAPNDATRYTETMKNNPFGHALFVPESSTALMPDTCGYIDDLGRWAPVTYIDDEEQLTAAGLSLPSDLSTRSPRTHTWGPKISTDVNVSKFEVKIGTSAISAGFPASVKLVLDFASSSSYNAILHCPKPVKHEGYYHRQVLEPWHRNCAAAGAGLRSCPAAWRCHMTAGGGRQNTTTGSCWQSLSPFYMLLFN
jgi:hypothetical protein